MSSVRPNDQMRLPGFGVPVDPRTGNPLSTVILKRMERLFTAEREFRLVLHELDGTTEGSRPGNHRMDMAFARLEEAVMWAQASMLYGEN